MGFNSIQSYVGVGKTWAASLLQKIADNFDALNGGLSTNALPDILNGSFEINSLNDGLTPDSWTIVNYTGGSHALETTSPAHGANALKFVHPGGAGNGGGYADSDYFPVNELVLHSLSGIIWASAATKSKVQVRYFTNAKVELGAGSPEELIVFYSLSPTRYTWQILPPATTRFIKIRLIGGYTDTAVAGNIFFDGFTFGPSIGTNEMRFNRYNTTPVLSANGTYLIPHGIYYVYADSIAVPQVQLYNGTAWIAGATISTGSWDGPFVSDGTNVRLLNTTANVNTVTLIRM